MWVPSLTPILGHHGSLLLFCCYECHLVFCNLMALGLNFSDKKRKEMKQMIVWNPKFYQNSYNNLHCHHHPPEMAPTSPRAKAKILITIFNCLNVACYPVSSALMDIPPSLILQLSLRGLAYLLLLKCNASSWGFSASNILPPDSP